MANLGAVGLVVFFDCPSCSDCVCLVLLFWALRAYSGGRQDWILRPTLGVCYGGFVNRLSLVVEVCSVVA